MKTGLMMLNSKIKIIVCDDLEEMRRFLVQTINKQDDMKVVATASNKNEAVKAAQTTPADIILMDIQMESEFAGIEATEEIVADNPNTKVVILTIFETDELIINAYYAGAVDYIVKMNDREQICQRIREIYSKNDFLGPLMVKSINKELRRSKKIIDNLISYMNSFASLTQTEKEIIKLLHDGYSRNQIADAKYLSVSTVKSHIRHILAKFGVKSTKELLELFKDTQIFDNKDIWNSY